MMYDACFNTSQYMICQLGSNYYCIGKYFITRTKEVA